MALINYCLQFFKKKLYPEDMGNFNQVKANISLGEAIEFVKNEISKQHADFRPSDQYDMEGGIVYIPLLWRDGKQLSRVTIPAHITEHDTEQAHTILKAGVLDACRAAVKEPYLKQFSPRVP